MLKRLMIAALVIIVALAVYVPRAAADGPDGLKVKFTLQTDYQTYGDDGSEVVNLQARPNDSIQYYIEVSNAGEAPITAPVVTEHEWSTGTLRFVNTWTFGSRWPSPGQWSMTTLELELEHFRLVYTPPEGGLLPGEWSTLSVNYVTKCNGDFASIIGTVPSTGWAQRFNIGLPDLYAGAQEFRLSGTLVYNNGEFPRSGEVTVATRCHTVVARLPVVEGWFTSEEPILALGADYYLAFYPSAEEALVRGLSWQSWGFGLNVRPTAASPETIWVPGSFLLQ